MMMLVYDTALIGNQPCKKDSTSNKELAHMDWHRNGHPYKTCHLV
jgi:hypothetical protein